MAGGWVVVVRVVVGSGYLVPEPEVERVDVVGLGVVVGVGGPLVSRGGAVGGVTDESVGWVWCEFLCC